MEVASANAWAMAGIMAMSALRPKGRPGGRGRSGSNCRRVGRAVHLAAGGAKVYAAGIERVGRHRVAEDIDVAILLRQAAGQRLPLVAAAAAAVDAEFSFRRVMQRVARDRDDVDRLRLVGVDVDREAEIRGQVAADLVPICAGVVAAHHVPMFLHEDDVRPRRVHGDAVDAVADQRIGVGNILGAEAVIDRLPVGSAVVGAKSAGGGDGDVDAVGIGGVEQDGVQPHAAGAGRPLGARAVAAEAGQLVPVFAAVGGAEDRGVFDAGVDRVGIGRATARCAKRV